jgi:hypothetical protein
VWILGIFSMFADMPSEMIHALLPFYRARLDACGRNQPA